MFIKVPYPYDKKGEGKWVECKTPYEKRMFKKYAKNKQLPTSKEKPSE